VVPPKPESASQYLDDMIMTLIGESNRIDLQRSKSVAKKNVREEFTEFNNCFNETREDVVKYVD
jgi:hypothetical protein